MISALTALMDTRQLLIRFSAIARSVMISAYEPVPMGLTDDGFSAIARSVMISALGVDLDTTKQVCFSAIARSVMISA